MPSLPVIKAVGLKISPNQLNLPDGSLTTASNVIIRRDNVLESRRGMTEYGTAFGSVGDTAKQLLQYKDRILRYYNQTIEYDTNVLNSDKESVFSAFAGSYSEVSPGTRLKSVEANNNFYFTTNDGIKKISAKSAANFTGNSNYITNAGGVKALDISTRLNVTLESSTGFLPVDSTVAYRVVWGTTDANNNLILGTPSSRSVIYLPQLEMTIRDMMNVLGALDNLNQTGSIYNDGNYVSTLGLTVNSSAQAVLTNLQALCSKIDLEQGNLADTADIISAAISNNICTVTFNAGYSPSRQFQVGDYIYLTGFTCTAGTINGIQQVIGVDLGSSSATLKFTTTTASGSITVASQSIQSGWFRHITVPASPAVPATNNDVAAIQGYLASIITELQSSRNVRQVAKNNGSATAVPLELTTIGIAASTVTVNVDAAGDTRNFVKTGDLVNLDGTWKDSTGTPVSFAGLQTVTGQTATTFTMTIAGLTNPGVIDSTSAVSRVLRFTSQLQAAYILPLDITTSANVDVTITVPTDVTDQYFYQIYRSPIVIATGTDVILDLIPTDELQLVYENFPTNQQLLTRQITVTDIVPASFSQGATNLYTNQFSGETIAQANDRPPVALDINNFFGYTLYANTRTLYRLPLFLLGVTNIIADYNNGLNPSITVADGTTTNTYRFIKGVQQVSTVTVNTSLQVGAAPGTYFLLTSSENVRQYYVWYKKIGSLTTDPAPAGYTGVQVLLPTGFTQAQVASATADKINTLVDDFSATSNATQVIITNITEGPCNLPAAGTSTFTFSNVSGAGEIIASQISTLTLPAGSVFPTTGASPYFRINSAFDRKLYYVWFAVGSSLDPTPAGLTGIRVQILNSDTNAQIAIKVSIALLATGVFTTSVNTNTITVTGIDPGPTLAVSPLTASGTMSGITGYSASIVQSGDLGVLLSSLISPSLAVAATATSLVKVMNLNPAEVNNAFYISDENSTPGSFLLESRKISNPKFYVLANQTQTGNSFNPAINPSSIVTSAFNTAANPTVVTVNNHGLENGDEVIVSGSTGSVPSLNGLYTVSNVTTNTFTIPVNVISIDGTPANVKGALEKADNGTSADNEQIANRLYYSKFQQPEAVPTLNYIDIGVQNKAILRIFPLRDSLFVFKEDGLFRVSGQTAPFQVNLFDSSCILIAPDSVDIANNIIFCWARQGITQVTESGADIISRDIDTIILTINNFLYPNFSTATWGVGYQSDSSYTVYTVSKATDTVATIGYRYGILTNSWTTFDKSYKCGLISQTNDKMYVGSGESNSLEIERKNFDRTDYADKEILTALSQQSVQNGKTLNVNGQTLFLGLLPSVNVGDVITQDQTISIYNYNQLLHKLDLDSGPASKNYFSALEATPGNDMRLKLQGLATKLDQDANISIVKTFLPANVNTGTDTITITNHGLVNSDPLFFTNIGGALPTGLSAGTVYYVVSAATNTFKVSLSKGGAAVDITTQGTGSNTVQKSVYSNLIISRSNISITSNSASTPTRITAPNHDLQTGRFVTIVSNTGSTPTINGNYEVTVVDDNTFTVPVTVLTGGTGGNFTTQDENFLDINACYNIIIKQLNADPHTAFKNYAEVDQTTAQEAIITAINPTTNALSLNLTLPFILGPVTVYNSIPTEVVYAPQTMQDPLGLKHMREATLMLQSTAFTSAVLSFATDLLPELIEIPFNGQGNGIFGHTPNFGVGFFGGAGNSAPFRTYIPRQCQRCRYLIVQYNHNTAREKWSIYGLTLTGEVSQSTRAYR